MAECEVHRLGDTALHLCSRARARGEERGRSQVIVYLRVSEFRDELENAFSIYPTTISCSRFFYPGHLSLSEALPSIVSLVASHLDSNKRQLCERRLLHFALQAAAGMAIGSALELLFDISALVSPGWLAEDVEVMVGWMLDTPLEVEEEDDMDAYYSQGFDGFGGKPASRSFIENLELLPYDGAGEGIREKQCIICLEDFDVGAQVSKMPCSHTFHNQCIIHWLEESHLCPICRHEMPS